MSNRLGGSIFVRNAIRYDYCIKEAIDSLEACCDEVAVLDCYSDDGTIDLLADHCRSRPKIHFMQNGTWDCAPDYHKLSKLANMCAGKLSKECNWHFMLQADEVIHEKSFKYIRQLMKTQDPKIKAYAVRRLNLFGDVDHHIRLDLPSKPCSDQPNRLGRRECQAAGDGESFEYNGINTKHIDDIVIFHYGYVRKNEQNLQKAIDMQSWFWGDQSQDRIDKRLLAMRDSGEGWNADKLIPRDHLSPIPLDHPTFSKAWAAERR